MKHNYIRQGNDGLHLRPLSEEHLEAVRIWRNQDHVRSSFIHDQVISSEQQKSWFLQYAQADDDYMFIIEQQELGPIGAIAIYNVDPAKKEAELGRLLIGEAAANGRGYGVGATDLACRFAFEELNMHRIKLQVLENNHKAISVYLKCGFVAIDRAEANGKRLITMNKIGKSGHETHE